MNDWLKSHQSFLKPISDEAPCGENLEYDQAFILLFASVEPKIEAQYGDFTSEPDSINWGEVGKNTETLMLRSRDIRLLTLWLRAQMNVAGAEGLATGLSLLAGSLAQYPEQVYPLIEVDGERDEFYRANALSALLDTSGFLAELRQVYLSRNNAYRLQIRDVERAASSPRPSDALPIANIVQQLNALLDKESKELKALEDSSALIKQIQALANEQLPEYAPSLEPVIKLLGWFDAEPPVLLQKNGLYRPNANSNATTSEDDVLSTEQSAQVASATSTSVLSMVHDAVGGRMEAQALIRQARLWFMTNEPSSPVSLLLQQAEGLIGKPFEQVFQAIPAELVAQWREQSNENSD